MTAYLTCPASPWGDRDPQGDRRVHGGNRPGDHRSGTGRFLHRLPGAGADHAVDLIDQPAGVGFLMTAKSILRFGDVRDSSQRKHTEYVIIGTFMSFGWGLLIAVLMQLGIRHWTVAPTPS
jgi:hypothetical protein